MSARAKIEELTHGWYAMVVIGFLAGLVTGGFGFFNLFFSGFALMFGLALTWWLNKKLLGKSSLVRLVLVVLSGIGLVFGALGMVKFVFASWSFTSLVMAGVLAGNWWMNLRSFLTLRDSSVKAYFD